MPDAKIDYIGANCPIPLQHKDQIVIGHGSGGRMTHDLISQVFQKYLSNSFLDQNNDAAFIRLDGTQNLSVSTDCHIVSPVFFPGGDIGRLAISGTVNDVAMLGATPKYITAGFILEEGFLIADLERILSSMRSTADEAGVLIVAGDTKVVEKGKADQIFITTSGVGVLDREHPTGGQNAQPGDLILISGSIGDHGMAVVSARGELGLESQITSDVAPLNHMIAAILASAPGTHTFRDPTRGGVATTLNEIAAQSQVGMLLYEDALPIKHEVQAACNLLGFDPLYVANEGKLLVIVPKSEAENAISAMKTNPYGSDACVIGEVTSTPPGRVLLKTAIGATRILDSLSGSMLPRIC